ncbi:MAG TPA: GNAT family N-acetyltransferase, partial [Actinomycetes bacterium]
VVGQRVVVRRVLRGQTGPSGGPALTDLLGVCEAWGPEIAAVRGEDGALVEIPLADIVSGKPVPPRPSRFTRLSVDEVERRATALFRPAVIEEVGDWLLRYSGGVNGRPNSILPIGDPGLPLEEALAVAETFYAAHDRSPCAQVVVGSEVQVALEDRGWTRLRPDESDTDVQLVGVAALSRTLAGVDTGTVDLADTVRYDWLVGNDRAQANFAVVSQSLALPDAAFVEIAEDGAQVARGRVNLDGDWAFFGDLTVQPAARRRGLARTVMAAVTAWSAERGASVMLLQVLADNEPAQALYASLGFERHHSYRYLTPPDVEPVATR